MTIEGSRLCSSLQPGPQLLSHLLGKYEVGQCGLALEQVQRPLSLFRALPELRKEGEMLLVSGATSLWGTGGWAAPGLQLSPSHRWTIS